MGKIEAIIQKNDGKEIAIGDIKRIYLLADKEYEIIYAGSLRKPYTFAHKDEDERVYNKAKELIGEENILQYRPTVISGNPDTMFDFEALIPDTITIWLRNGDTIMYRSND